MRHHDIAPRHLKRLELGWIRLRGLALDGKNLLPSIEEDQALIRKMVDLGGVDGMENAQVYKVDGFTLEENSKTLQMLHDYLAERGVR